MSQKPTFYCDLSGTLLDGDEASTNGLMLVRFLQAAHDHGCPVHTISTDPKHTEPRFREIYGDRVAFIADTIKDDPDWTPADGRTVWFDDNSDRFEHHKAADQQGLFFHPNGKYLPDRLQTLADELGFPFKARLFYRLEGDRFVETDSVPDPSDTPLLADQILGRGEAIFTERQVWDMAQSEQIVGPLTIAGFSDFVQALHAYHPSGAIWERGYHYMHGIEQDLLKNTTTTFDAMKRDGVAFPGQVLQEQNFAAVHAAVSLGNANALNALFHAFEGKFFFRSMMKATFRTALLSENTDYLDQVLKAAYSDEGYKQLMAAKKPQNPAPGAALKARSYDNYAMSLLLSDEGLAIAVASQMDMRKVNLALFLFSQYVPRERIDAIIREAAKTDSALQAAVDGFMEARSDARNYAQRWHDSRRAKFYHFDPYQKKEKGPSLPRHPVFSQAVYHDLLPTLQVNYLFIGGPQTMPQDTAFKLATLFDDVGDARRALIAYQAYHSDIGVCLGVTGLNFKLPANSDWTPSHWRRAFIKVPRGHFPKMIAKADHVEKRLTAIDMTDTQTVSTMAVSLAESGTMKPLEGKEFAHLLGTLPESWNRAGWVALGENYSNRLLVPLVRNFEVLEEEARDLDSFLDQEEFPTRIEPEQFTPTEILFMAHIARARGYGDFRRPANREERYALIEEAVGAAVETEPDTLDLHTTIPLLIGTGKYYDFYARDSRHLVVRGALSLLDKDEWPDQFEGHKRKFVGPIQANPKRLSAAIAVLNVVRGPEYTSSVNIYADMSHVQTIAYRSRIIRQILLNLHSISETHSPEARKAYSDRVKTMRNRELTYAHRHEYGGVAMVPGLSTHLNGTLKFSMGIKPDSAAPAGLFIAQAAFVDRVLSLAEKQVEGDQVPSYPTGCHQTQLRSAHAALHKAFKPG